MCVFCLGRCWYLDREIFDIYLLLLVMLVAKAHTQNVLHFYVTRIKKWQTRTKRKGVYPALLLVLLLL